MPRWWSNSYLAGPGVFLALTGVVGLLPPRVVQLGECTDFCFKRMVTVVCVFLVGGLWAFVLAAGRQWRASVCLGLLSVSVIFSGLFNWKMDQDPLAAWINYRAPFLDYDPYWQCRGIENHE